MEFLDPQKQKEHFIRLVIGYVLVGLALILTTTVLLYHARGFGIKDGEVIQSGLIFVSSTPRGAQVYVNDVKRQESTNTRILINAGQYTFELQRDGYHSWKRAVNVEGGVVVRFDYPMLFPNKLTTTTIKRYTVQPPLTLQSPDRRWLLIQNPSALAGFEVYDLNNPQAAPTAATIPDNLVGLQGGLHSWAPGEWSIDNRHVLLTHTMQKDSKTSTEYLLLDRENPAASLNLTTTLHSGSAIVSLRGGHFDQYYLFDAAAQTVTKATQDEPVPTAFLQHVLAFAGYSEETVAYITTQGAPNGSALAKLHQGDQTTTIRTLTQSPTYMLDLTSYKSAWYVAVGSPLENKTYVYKNPTKVHQAKPNLPLVPVQVLKVAAPSFVSFSDSARFVMVEAGQRIAVYDAETDRGYAYDLGQPIDAPQAHAQWMDGSHLMAVIGGKVQVFDFDNANSQALSASSPAFRPYFDRDGKYVYTLLPEVTRGADGKETTSYNLNSTALRTPEDL